MKTGIVHFMWRSSDFKLGKKNVINYAENDAQILFAQSIWKFKCVWLLQTNNRYKMLEIIFFPSLGFWGLNLTAKWEGSKSS